MQNDVLKHGGGLNKPITDPDGVNWLWLITDYYQNLTVSDRMHPSYYLIYRYYDVVRMSESDSI